jgi:hypothetical protein
MKNLILLLTLIHLVYISKAQQKIEVTLAEKVMSLGKQTAFVVEVPESKVDFVVSRWKKYANDRSIIETIAKGAIGRFVGNTYKSVANTISPEKKLEKNKMKLRVEKEHDEFIIRNITHKYITEDLLDVYAKIIQLDNGTQVSAFFRFSDSIFINESNVDEETILSIKSYMYEFGISTYKGVVENQIKVAEKELRRMNIVLSNMKSRNDYFEESITRNESEINICQEDIRQNDEQFILVEDLISEMKKQMLGESKSSTQYQEYKDSLKEKQKEKRKIENQNKNLKAKIKSRELKIRNLFAEIANNKKEQRLQQVEIEKQENIIKELETKLNQIK